MTPTQRQPRTFAVGDRVVALPNTAWDTDGDLPPPLPVRFAGNYGHVVGTCHRDGVECSSGMIHVVFEGTIDGRGTLSLFVSATAWHLYPDEIEHAD